MEAWKLVRDVLFAVAILALCAALLSGCSPMESRECPKGTVQTDDDMQVICVEPSAATPDAANDAAERAAQEHEDAYDNCRNDGNSEEYCIQNIGPP